MPKRERELRKITVSVEWFTVCLTDETFVDALSHLIVMKLIECFIIASLLMRKPQYREIISYVQGPDRQRQVTDCRLLRTGCRLWPWHCRK